MVRIIWLHMKLTLPAKKSGWRNGYVMKKKQWGNQKQNYELLPLVYTNYYIYFEVIFWLMYYCILMPYYLSVYPHGVQYLWQVILLIFGIMFVSIEETLCHSLFWLLQKMAKINAMLKYIICPLPVSLFELLYFRVKEGTLFYWIY